MLPKEVPRLVRGFGNQLRCFSAKVALYLVITGIEKCVDV
jgi:hypothetical protein